MAYTKFKYLKNSYIVFDIDGERKHCYEDYGLVLSSYKTGVPRVKTSKVSAKTINGDIDFTEIVNTTPKYENIRLEFVFKVLEGMGQFGRIKRDFIKAYHGKLIKLEIHDKDADIYERYTGRLFVNEFECDKYSGTIVVDVDALPNYEIYNRDIYKAIKKDGSFGVFDIRNRGWYFGISLKARVINDVSGVRVWSTTLTNEFKYMALPQGYANIQYSGSATEIEIEYEIVGDALYEDNI